MNFLQIAQRVRQECGISGTGPAAVTNQTGELKKVVDWSNTAWQDIQNAHYDWNFMWSNVTFNITTEEYLLSELTDTITSTTLDTIVDHFDKKSFRMYKSSTGVSDQGSLKYENWPTFRRLYRTGTIGTDAPEAFSLSPSGSILFSSTPDATYVVDADVYKLPSTLSANTDTPTMPSRYHMAIVWRAVMYFAGHDESATLYQDAYNKFMSFMGPLERHEIIHEDLVVIPE